MKILLYLFVLSFAFPLVVFSQTNYKEGYVIKNNGDTVTGYINYKEWLYSPKSINFVRSKVIRDVVQFTPAVIKSFVVNGVNKYITYKGPVSTSKITPPDVPMVIDSAFRNDTVFLKVISSGPNVTLLYQEDDIKTRYFITDDAAVPVELKYYVYQDENGKIFFSSRYKSQLAALLSKYKAGDKNVVKSLLDAEYNEYDLIKYVRIINGNKENTNSSKQPYRFYVGAAATYIASTFTGAPLLGYNTSNSNITAQLNGGIDFFSDPSIQKLIFRADVSVSAFSQQFTCNDAVFKLTQYNLALTPQVILNIYNTDQFKFFVGVGIAVNASYYPTNQLIASQGGVVINPFVIQGKGETYISLAAGQYITNPYSEPPIWVNGLVKSGIVLNKKLELYVSYSFVTTQSSIQVDTRYNAVGINYLFGGTK